ncbi:MAG: PIN domain-containing protein [Pseudomonadota bacterium]|nr:PIN domain-containing protein [Pseudomonadota bacterium]
MIYLDSSVLLELYLGQPRADEARALLAAPLPLVSSWLLAVEVPVVLRRALSARPVDAPLLAAALARFDADVEAVSLFSDTAGVARRVRADARLAHCRTLDAIHAASALLLQEMAGTSVSFATFDRRLGDVAARLPLGLALTP